MTGNPRGNSSKLNIDPAETEPGFDHLPDLDPQRPAATDMIDDAVDKGLEKLRDDFTGTGSDTDQNRKKR